jgi:hypothetical protein
LVNVWQKNSWISAKENAGISSATRGMAPKGYCSQHYCDI